MKKLYLNEIKNQNLVENTKMEDIRKWLKDRNIEVFYDGKPYVNDLEFEFITKPPQPFRLKFPKKWR